MRRSPRIFSTGFCEEVDDQRLVRLPVAVDAAVALLEHHQRPRQIEVHEAMAEVMQVQALRRHVGAEQHAQRISLPAEAFDEGLLVGVGELPPSNDLRSVRSSA